MNRATLDAIRMARHARQSLSVVTDLATGAQAQAGSAEADTAVAALIARGKSGLVPGAEGERFVQIYAPAPRLVVIGAVHIAQALAPLARLADFAVSVIDPRGAFASAARFPDSDLVQEWPDRALEASRPDIGTAVVALTHDPKLDDPALAAALRSPAFYIGALGSRKSHARRLDRLRAAGFADTELARIHGPVGLAIGAVSPAEIAISVLAEIIAVRRGGRLAGRGE
jgi:xanthine dehydrogenase accessory factor